MYYSQITGVGFEPMSLSYHCPSRYCNHTAMWMDSCDAPPYYLEILVMTIFNRPYTSE